MTTNISVFENQVGILIGPVQGDIELSSYEVQAMIKAAVERYSRDRPDDVTEDESGDGGIYYDIATLLGSWVEDFSRIVSIQYPAEAISEDSLPQYLDEGDWVDDYWQNGTRYLLFNNIAPASTDTFRVKYTIPYVFTSSATTTPTQDFYAICNLAAGLCCEVIAVKYSRTSDSTISVDSVDHLSRADQFRLRAREYIAFYEKHLGLDGADGAGREFPAGDFVDWDTMPPGRDYLFHSSATR